MNIINLQRVIDKTTLGRSTLYAYMKLGKFPTSVLLGDRHVGWVEAEVDAWIDGRIKASRQAVVCGGAK